MNDMKAAGLDVTAQKEWYQALLKIKDIAGFAQGTDYVPKTGLAVIHKGEAVIPASENGKGKSVNITVELDGRVLLRALGQPLADTIRLKASAVI